MPKTLTPEYFLNLSLSYYVTEHYADCIAAARKAIELRPDYAVAYNNIAAAYNDLAQWDLAIEAANEAIRIRPDFELAKNNLDAALSQKSIYSDSAAREVQQERAAAMAARIERHRENVIAINRPGAIGDILMTLNLIPAFKKANPGKEIWYFCHDDFVEPYDLGNIILAAGCDRVLNYDTITDWTPDVDRVLTPMAYPSSEGYPLKPMSDHLINYFARELGLETMPELPSLRIQCPKRPANVPEEYATLQWLAGWSVYKQWPFDRWEALVRDLEFPVVMMSPQRTPSISEAIALVANARIHIGIDSFANHLSNYTWIDEYGNGRKIPSVILWGSTQASAAGYPHNTNISLGLECQPCFREDPKKTIHIQLGHCINPPGQDYENPRHACMANITVDAVLEAVRSKWEESGT